MGVNRLKEGNLSTDTKRLKVTLVVGNLKWHDDDVNAQWHYIPYNLCLLAAMVEDRADVNILDANKRDLSKEEFMDEIRKTDPDVVGTSILFDQYADVGHSVAEMVKTINPNTKVLFGGVYSTMNPQNVINDPNIDYLILGEGEYIFQELIDCFRGAGPLPKDGICYRDENGKPIVTERRGFIENLDELPMPAYHLIDYLAYASCATRKSVDTPPGLPYARMFTSRGCPYGCTFCQVESINGAKYRPRGIDNVMNEIEFLKKTYGIKSITFDDDNMYTDKNHAKKFFQAMIDRKIDLPWVSTAVAVFRLDEELITLMRKSGCTYIDIAIESGTERVTKEIVQKPLNHKQAKHLVKFAQSQGIYVAANFIVGFPTETWDEIRQTIAFAEELDLDYAKIFSLIPLKNTKIWDLCEENGFFREGFSDKTVHWSAGQVSTKDFRADDLTVLRAYEWDRINFTDPKKRKRTCERMGVTEEELLQIRRRTLDNAAKMIRTSGRYVEEGALC